MKLKIIRSINIASMLLILLFFFLPIIRWVGGTQDNSVIVADYPFLTIPDFGFVSLVYLIAALVSLLMNIFKPKMWTTVIQQTCYICVFVVYMILLIFTCATDALQIVILILMGLVFIVHEFCLVKQFIYVIKRDR